MTLGPEESELPVPDIGPIIARTSCRPRHDAGSDPRAGLLANRGASGGTQSPGPKPWTLHRKPIVDLGRVLYLARGARPASTNPIDQTTDLGGVIIRLWFVHEELRLQGHRG